MQKQIEAYEIDLIGPDDLKAARERIETERREIERKIRELESKSNDSSAVQKKAVEFLPTINGIDRLAAKNAIRGLIEEIRVREGKLVEITWKA
jgi:site-specific DNA recombinase